MHPRTDPAHTLAHEVAHAARLLQHLQQSPDAAHAPVQELISVVAELHADGVRRLQTLPRRNPHA